MYVQYIYKMSWNCVEEIFFKLLIPKFSKGRRKNLSNLSHGRKFLGLDSNRIYLEYDAKILNHYTASFSDLNFHCT
jgi:hypothetical protein